MLSLHCRFGLAVLALIAAPLAAASISLPLPWKQGTELRYRVSTLDIDQGPGRSRKIDSRSVERLKIAEANPQGFLQVWTFESEQITVSGNADDIPYTRRMAEAIGELLKRQPVQAELDSDGTFVRVRNWQYFSKGLREALYPILIDQNRRKLHLSPEAEAEMRKKVQPGLDKLTGEQGIANSIGEQAHILNFFTKPKLPASGSVDYSDYVPSPWSPDLIPTRGSFRVLEIKPDRVSIRWTHVIDPENGPAVMWQIVQSLSGAKPSAEERKHLPVSMSLHFEATVVLERSSGLPLRLEYLRRVAAGERQKSVTTLMERIP